MSFDGWEIKKDEIVRTIDTIFQQDEERKIQDQIQRLFSMMDIQASGISETTDKTSDYQGAGIDFEVTAIHVYIPRTSDIENRIFSSGQEFGKCHFMYMYSDEDIPKLVELGEEECGQDASVFCIRQHISVYFRKIINKINSKSMQNTKNPNQVIVIDFRGAEFDAITLKKGVSWVLTGIGMSHSNLIGVIAALPMKIDSDILSEPFYFFVVNPYATHQESEVFQKLESISRVQTSRIIMPVPILTRFVSGKTISLKSPCINMPDFADFSHAGLTTWPYELDRSGIWSVIKD